MPRITQEDLAALARTEEEIKNQPEATDHPAVTDPEPLPAEPPAPSPKEVGSLIAQALNMGAIVIGPDGEVHTPEGFDIDKAMDKPCGAMTLLFRDCRGDHRMCDTHGKPMQMVLVVEKMRQTVGAKGGDLLDCPGGCGRPMAECWTVEAIND